MENSKPPIYCEDLETLDLDCKLYLFHKKVPESKEKQFSLFVKNILNTTQFVEIFDLNRLSSYAETCALLLAVAPGNQKLYQRLHQIQKRISAEYPELSLESLLPETREKAILEEIQQNLANIDYSYFIKNGSPDIANILAYYLHAIAFDVQNTYFAHAVEQGAVKEFWTNDFIYQNRFQESMKKTHKEIFKNKDPAARKIVEWAELYASSCKQGFSDKVISGDGDRLNLESRINLSEACDPLGNLAFSFTAHLLRYFYLDNPAPLVKNPLLREQQSL